jgi:predicted PurR-regulated permease PerM
VAKQPSGDRFASIPLWVLALVGLTLFLREARTLFVPIALAMLAAYALQPVIDRLDRLRLPRSVSAALAVSVIAALVGWTGWALSDDFAQLVDDLPRQVREVRRQLQASVAVGILDDLNEAASEIEEDREPAPGTKPDASSSPAQRSNDGPGLSDALPTGALANYLWQGSANLFSLMGHIVVVAFLTYFFLIGSPAWHDRLVRLSGTLLSSRRTGAEVLGEVTQQVQRFLLMRVVTSLVVAGATWLALIYFGAPAPALWAVAAGVFNWVPYFGPVIVSSGLAVVGLVAGGLSMALELSLSTLIITSLEGWLLTPLLLGRAARINTLAIFLSLLFWSWVWGIWGTILAVPLTSVIKAIADHVEPLDWLAELLAEDRASARSVQ